MSTFVKIKCGDFGPALLAADEYDLVSIAISEEAFAAHALGFDSGLCMKIHDFLKEYPRRHHARSDAGGFPGKWDDLAIVYQALFDLGADPNAEGYVEYFDADVPAAVLADPAIDNRADVVKILIDAGIDVNAHDSWEFREGQPEVSLLLLDAGMDPNGYNGEGMHMAAAWGQTAVIKKTIEKGGYYVRRSLPSQRSSVT